MSEKPNEAKEYLQSVKSLDKRIDNKLEQLSHLQALALKVTTHLKPDAAFGGGTHDKVGDSVIRIMELQEEINRSIDEYVDKKIEVMQTIDMVNDPDHVAVLRKRYLEYEPWAQIAEEMGYSHRNICYIHGRALQAVEAILKARNDDGETA